MGERIGKSCLFLITVLKGSQLFFHYLSVCGFVIDCHPLLLIISPFLPVHLAVIVIFRISFQIVYQFVYLFYEKRI